MERLNRWLMLFANLGVIAGIVFLGYEIRVNTQALTATTSTSFLQNTMSANSLTLSDPELPGLEQTVNAQGWEKLTPEQRTRILSYRLVQLKASEYAHFQWSEGLLDDRLWKSNNSAMYAFLWDFDDAMEAYTFAGINLTFNDDFREFADEMVADICARKTCRSQSPFPGKMSDARSEGLEAWLGRLDTE